MYEIQLTILALITGFLAGWVFKPNIVLPCMDKKQKEANNYAKNISRSEKKSKTTTENAS